MRSRLATSFDEYQNTRSLLAISFNLESHLAIPFIQTKYEVPSGDLQIVKYEIPSGDLHRLESHLAIPFIQSDMRGPFWRPPSKYEIPSGDLNNLESHLAIPFIQKTRSHLATSK